MVYVIGVDQSVLHTGVSILNTETEDARLVLIEPDPAASSIDRLVYLYNALEKTLDDCFVKLAILEGYSLGSINRPFDLGEVGGVVKVVLYKHAETVLTVAPKQLKKFITGKGAATKKEMQYAISSLYNQTIDDDNLADAYGLSQIAKCMLDSKKAVRREQIELVLALQSTGVVVKPKAVKQSRYRM